MKATLIQEKVQKTLSLGFIGLGWIGRNRMEVLLQNGYTKAIAIAEPIAANASEALKIANGAAVTDSPAEIYAHPDIDAVVIATPSAMHAGQAIKALSAGKAVFCQKPLGRNAKEVQQVVAAARKTDKLLAIDLSYRHTKAFQAVYDLVQRGGIGEVFSVGLTFHNAYGPDKDWFYDPKQSGGGCVMDLGIHMVDLALWTLDFPTIANIQSHLFRHGKKWDPSMNTVEDFAKATLATTKGAVINLECSWNLSAGQDAVIEARFYGTKGGAVFKNVNGSFYDFTAEKLTATQTEVLVAPPDSWSGRVGTVWAEKLLAGKGFDAQSSKGFIKTAETIDRIYGR